MLRRTKEPGSPGSASVTEEPLRPVHERADVRAATQALADATARLAQAEQGLAEVLAALEAAERQAGAEWQPGAALPPVITAAFTQRAEAESRVRVARHAVDAAREQSRLVLARAQAQFREELAGRERALVAELDQVLLAAGQLNLALVALHQAAHATFGSGHGANVWTKAFPPLTPSWRGEVPGAVQVWRRVLRKHGILSAAGGDQDWETLCAPVRDTT